MSDSHTVFIVSDDPSVSDLYGLRLDDRYAVRTAESREAALERVDDEVAVLLLDRRMPNVAGEELLSELRERGIDCRAAMISRVRPERNVLDQGFDAVLVTPVSADELNDTVEQLCRRVDYDELLREVTRLQSRRANLERRCDRGELAESDEYQSLTARFEELRGRLDELADEMDPEGISATLHSLSRRSRQPSR